jgi:VWFA-related protein
MRLRFSLALCASVLAALAVVSAQGQSQRPERPNDGQESFRFKSGVELINVTATVTDANGRFVPGLRQDDFVVYEDNEQQQITHFSSDRVPVSLGIALDTSSSMMGEKIDSARSALDRFLYDLLDAQDEIFLYQFSNDPNLLQGWTTDRQKLSRALNRATPHGGTAMYDAVSEAIPLVQQGQFRKKRCSSFRTATIRPARRDCATFSSKSAKARRWSTRSASTAAAAARPAAGAAAFSSSGGRRFRSRFRFPSREAAADGRVRSRRTSLVGGRRRAPIP